MLRQMICVAALAGTMAMAQTTAPVRAEATAAASQGVAEDELTALRKEVADLRAEVARLRAPQPGTPVKADTVKADTAPPMSAPALAPMAGPAPMSPVVAPPQPVQPAYKPVAAMESRNVKVANVSVTDLRQGGKPGITVTADVTLNNVPNVPYTFEAALVTPDGQIHTDVRGKPYVTSREVRTGDDFDTDDYSVWMDLSTLFTSRPPEDLYVQVRVLDLMGRPVAASQLHTFHRPWK